MNFRLLGGPLFGTRAVRAVAKPRGLIGQHACHAIAPSPPRKAEALKQARLLRGLLQLVKPVEHGAAARPSKLRLEECDALQGGLSLR